MQYLAQDRLPLEIKVQAKNYRDIQKLEVENLKTKQNKKMNKDNQHQNNVKKGKEVEGKKKEDTENTGK